MSIVSMPAFATCKQRNNVARTPHESRRRAWPVHARRVGTRRRRRTTSISPHITRLCSQQKLMLQHDIAGQRERKKLDFRESNPGRPMVRECGIARIGYAKPLHQNPVHQSRFSNPPWICWIRLILRVNMKLVGHPEKVFEAERLLRTSLLSSNVFRTEL